MAETAARSGKRAEAPGLRPGEVHVVEVDLDAAYKSDVNVLDRQERERADRFIFERDRRRFVGAHVSLRVTLGAYLNQTPESLRFTTNTHGKPQIAERPVDLRFNLSHAGDRALVAVSLDHDVGVDIEQHRPVEVLQLAQRFFSRSEIDAITSLPPTEREAAFFRCWTRKEAFIKALGVGLSFPLDGFEVSVTDDESNQLLNGCSAAPDEFLRWRILSLPTVSGYSAAFVAKRDLSRVVRWRIEPSGFVAL
jgi:4'-phosphopantetheinyl transferase